MREVDAKLEDVRDALVALRLEVVLCHPEIVVSEVVHQGADCLGLVEHGDELLVRVESVVGGCARETNVIQVNVSGKQASEFVNHDDISRLDIRDIVDE